MADLEPSNRSSALPGVLIVQTEQEGLHTLIAHEGWNVLHHTNNPLPWLEDLTNLLATDAVLVSPLALTIEPIARDIEKLLDMVESTYLFVSSDTWLELSRV